MSLRMESGKRGVALAATLTAQGSRAHKAEPPAPSEFWVSNEDSHLKRKKLFS